MARFTGPIPPTPSAAVRVFRRSTWAEVQSVAEVFRRETVGGIALLGAAIIALIWANSPWQEAYAALSSLTVGPHALHLDLTLAQWAADGALAIFFFVAGLELKRELVAGDLRDPSRAVVPVVAAASGVIVPAVLYLATARALGAGSDVMRGWAVPTATDIAFALAVLAVAGTHLPSALRSFLLTLAVVDDLIAIVIIALVYSSGVQPLYLAAALLPLSAFAFATRRGVSSAWLLLPLAGLTWWLVHSAGVHATVAGVLLALSIPVGDVSRRLEHRVHPVSSALAVPLFAFFAAGVTLSGGLHTLVDDPAAVAVAVALLVGKMVGVLGGTFAVARFTKADLDEDLSWWDVFAVSLLAGIGFTVSLLVSELAFGSGSPHDVHVRAAVLGTSTVAALLAAVMLRIRSAAYRRIHDLESTDTDADGVPDVFEGILSSHLVLGPAPTEPPAGPTCDVSPGHTDRDEPVSS